MPIGGKNILGGWGCKTRVNVEIEGYFTANWRSKSGKIKENCSQMESERKKCVCRRRRRRNWNQDLHKTGGLHLFASSGLLILTHHSHFNWITWRTVENITNLLDTCHSKILVNDACRETVDGNNEPFNDNKNHGDDVLWSLGIYKLHSSRMGHVTGLYGNDLNGSKQIKIFSWQKLELKFWKALDLIF